MAATDLRLHLGRNVHYQDTVLGACSAIILKDNGDDTYFVKVRTAAGDVLYPAVRHATDDVAEDGKWNSPPFG